MADKIIAAQEFFWKKSIKNSSFSKLFLEVISRYERIKMALIA